MLLTGLTTSFVCSGAIALHFDDALGRWLPVLPDGFEPRRAHVAKFTRVQDWFLYPSGAKAPSCLNCAGPPDGTFFAYGQAGPPKVKVVYDREHKIVFYHEGCCSWSHTVAASGILPPPHAVTARDLSHLRTKRGLKLGDTVAQVRKVFGAAAERRVMGFSLVELSYYTPLEGFASSCLWARNFYFSSGRLRIIEYLGGC